jgi:hypothetical protein
VPEPAKEGEAIGKPAKNRRRFQVFIEREFRWHGRFWEGIGATVAVIAFLAMGATNFGPFAGAVPPTPKSNPSLWQYLLAEHWTLGAIHVAIIGLSLYAGASVVALACSGRWLRSLGRAGASVDPREVTRARQYTEELDKSAQSAQEWIERTLRGQWPGQP